MQRDSFAPSLLLSLTLHVVALVVSDLTVVLPVAHEPTEAIRIELGDGPGEAGVAAASPPPAPASQPASAPSAAAPSVQPRTVNAPPVARERALPATIDGVRLASAADIRARLERERHPAPMPRREVPPVPVAPPEARQPASDDPLPSSEPAIATGPARQATGTARASSEDGFFWRDGVLYERHVVRPGQGFSPDAPGYGGRVFGQVSVRGGAERDGFYGRIHLFQDDGVTRDYSDGSLFGYSFRQELPGGAVREFQAGRVQTHGAYLMVTDLFTDGRLSTMSHTVLLAFPRQPPANRNLYDVIEDGRGTFRLRGPNGAALVFDEKTEALRGASGFVVGAQGASSSPPQVSYRGLHVRIQAVGRNPFLRGRGATVVDARGAECAVSTSDLFLYDRRRRESDMFRYATDREFFGFLEKRCPGLALPRPADPRIVARAEKAPGEGGGSQGGLFGRLFRRSR